MNVFEEFQWRGLVYECTEGVADLLGNEKVTAYIGFDPTAASFHVGTLLPILALAHLQHYGHTPIALVGGGTGLIGDPSGKTEERKMLSKEKVEENLQALRAQLSKFLDFDSRTNPAKMIDNADWLTTVPLTDFLRDVGKHFTVNTMLAKESIRRRLEQEQGISYTEFSYMLLQSYDFLNLYDTQHCTLQMGGSDQWGNITAGIDLIRSTRGARAHGLVMPLLMSPSGAKFGKSEAGTVWLDPALTSPFRFYQYWLNTDDRDVILYLKFLTFLSREDIEALAAATASAPEKREAQRRLAQEVTRLVHGPEGLARAELASQVLFGAEIKDLSVKDVLDVFQDVPSSELPPFDSEGMPIVDLLALSGLAASKGDARRLLQSGGVYVNNRRVSDAQARVTRAESIGGQVIVLRKGQKQYHVIKIQS